MNKIIPVFIALTYLEHLGMSDLNLSSYIDSKALSFWSVELRTRLLLNQFSLTSSSAVVLVINR